MTRKGLMEFVPWVPFFVPLFQYSGIPPLLLWFFLFQRGQSESRYHAADSTQSKLSHFLR